MRPRGRRDPAATGRWFVVTDNVLPRHRGHRARAARAAIREDLPRARHRRQGAVPRPGVRARWCGPPRPMPCWPASRCSPDGRRRRRHGRRHRRRDDRRLLAHHASGRGRRAAPRTSSPRSGTRERSRATSACAGTPRGSSAPPRPSVSPCPADSRSRMPRTSRPMSGTSRRRPSGVAERQLAAAAAVVAARRHARPQTPSEGPRPLRDVQLASSARAACCGTPADGTADAVLDAIRQRPRRRVADPRGRRGRRRHGIRALCGRPARGRRTRRRRRWPAGGGGTRRVPRWPGHSRLRSEQTRYNVS